MRKRKRLWPALWLCARAEPSQYPTAERAARFKASLASSMGPVGAPAGGAKEASCKMLLALFITEEIVNNAEYPTGWRIK